MRKLSFFLFVTLMGSLLTGTPVQAQSMRAPAAIDVGRSCETESGAALDAVEALRAGEFANEGLEATESFEFGAFIFQRADGSYGWTIPTNDPPDAPRLFLATEPFGKAGRPGGDP